LDIFPSSLAGLLHDAQRTIEAIEALGDVFPIQSAQKGFRPLGRHSTHEFLETLMEI
jgi:hypothetical protein